MKKNGSSLSFRTLSAGKRFFSAALSLIVLFSCLTAAANDGDTALTLDQAAAAVIEEEDEVAVFTYTPEVSGTYTFRSLGSSDTICYLNDADYNELTCDEDGGGFLITWPLIAGNPVYFLAKYASETQTGSFSVLLSRVDVSWTVQQGVLRITGTSQMPEYGAGGAPWYGEKDSVTSIEIGSGIPNISDFAFVEFSNVTSVSIPGTVAEIGDSAFYGCSGLTSLSIPDGVTQIGRNAFQDCSGLTSLTLSSTVTDIGARAFSGCISLPQLTVPSGVRTIGDEAFFGCTDLTGLTMEEGTVRIGAAAFKNCFTLRSVHLPDTVTEIGTEAFAGCRDIMVMNIPDTAHFTGPDVLKDCNSLKDTSGFIILGSSLYAYYGTEVNVELPAYVRKIGDYVFYQNEQLWGVTIPDGLTSIGDFAFAFCTRLTDINIPDSLTSISTLAFIGTNFGDDNGFFIIGDVLYQYTGSDANVVIPDGVKTIAPLAFENCEDVQTVTVPDSLTRIGDSAFRGCSFLSDITAASGGQARTVYDYDMNGREGQGLYQLSLPASILETGTDAFAGTAVWHIIRPDFQIPENYETGLTIETEAFAGIAATYIVVPYSVGSIGSGTFANCRQLRFIYFIDENCAIAGDAFDGCNSSLILISQEASGSVSNVHRFANDHGFQFLAIEGHGG